MLVAAKLRIVNQCITLVGVGRFGPLDGWSFPKALHCLISVSGTQISMFTSSQTGLRIFRDRENFVLLAQPELNPSLAG